MRYKNRGFNCEWFARIDSRESRCESPVPLSPLLDGLYFFKVNAPYSGVAPANQTKGRSVHELFAGAFRNKSSMWIVLVFPKKKNTRIHKKGRNSWTFRFGAFFGLVCRGDSWLMPHEWPLKLPKWAFRAFKTRSLRGWDLQGSRLKRIFRSENQGNPLRQDFALFIDWKSRVLVSTWKRGNDPHPQDKIQHLDFTLVGPPATLLQDPSLCILPQECP